MYTPSAASISDGYVRYTKVIISLLIIYFEHDNKFKGYFFVCQLDQFVTETFRVAMHLDSFQQSKPLYKPVTYPQDVLAAYDRIIYYKVVYRKKYMYSKLHVHDVNSFRT
jgi:hypothetical protein